MLTVVNKMETINKAHEIMILLLKDFNSHTATSLSKKLEMSRWGMWKILKRLEKEHLIILKRVGSGKTSTQTIGLNWGNVLTEKNLALALTQEALRYKRWRFNFEKLEKYADFLIVFGSVLHSPEEANDVDVLVVAEKKNLSSIGDLIDEIQVSMEKNVHSINFTKSEFKKELKKGNKAYMDAVKKGVILFGQENFIKFIKGMQYGS